MPEKCKNCVDPTNKEITIALAGNPNVGKSVIFNKLTGLSQIVGNWPGKTVAKAEGICTFQGYTFKIIDLPGIYSLSTYSIEEIITRKYIVEEKPDYIINVLDANQLERNLFFTLQLQMLHRPMILALNQYDLLRERGYEIDTQKLSDTLQLPIEKVVAVHNRGVHELLERIIELEENKGVKIPQDPIFGKEIEEYLERISAKLPEFSESLASYPSKFIALKLLENDEVIIQELVSNSTEEIGRFIYLIDEIRQNLTDLHGEQISTILNGEFYNITGQLFSEVQSVKSQSRINKFRIFLDHITVHSIGGYFILFAVLFGTYILIFTFGDWISSLLDSLFDHFTPQAISFLGTQESWLYKVVWNGLVGGLVAGIGGVLPFVIPFYLIIEILQDIGYLPRAAYLMDRFMHHLGVHGKTIIPVLLGFGCSVPAVSACRIMENEKQRRRSILISTMIPCSATTTIVLGLVAKYLGIVQAILLYGILFIIIIAIGKIITIQSEVDDSELIIELHDFRKPNFSVIISQTWQRSREFVYMALPLMVGLGILMQIFVEFQILNVINNFMSPITVVLLGLPVSIGVYLIYGFLRKELNLILLELFVGSMGLTMQEYLTPLQMMIFTITILLYIPCLATFINIIKEAGPRFGWKLFFFRILLAIITSTIIRLLYDLVNLIFTSRVLKFLLGLVNLEVPKLGFIGQIVFTIIIFSIVLWGFLIVYKDMHHYHMKHHTPQSDRFHHKHRFGIAHFGSQRKHISKRHIKEFATINKCQGCSKMGSCNLNLGDQCIEIHEEEQPEEN